MEKTTMLSAKQFGLFVAVFALVIISLGATSVSAFGYIDSVEINDVEALFGTDVSVTAGDIIEVKVVFVAYDNADEVTIKAEVEDREGGSARTGVFDVIDGRTYRKTLSLKVPFDIDEHEGVTLEIEVDSDEKGEADRRIVEFTVQRESFAVQILDVNLDSNVKAGETLLLDVVLKNRGRQFSEDTFVVASIHSLGVKDRKYFGDLSAEDQSDPDKEDASERRLFLRIPENAPAGIYEVELQAFNDDTVSKVIRKVAISSSVEDSMVVSPTTSKTFGVGEEKAYSLTIVNAGKSIELYDLAFETAGGLKLKVEEPVIAIPAGLSKTVKVYASADEAGRYGFTVNVNSKGQLIKSAEFISNVEGNSTSGNATVLVTVILAIVFIVLLIVLMVLLTRKPERNDELGESYY
jgi:hypothetical protein